MIALVPLLVAIAGALLYALAQGKLSEIGRIAFMVGLFFLVWDFAGQTMRILK